MKGVSSSSVQQCPTEQIPKDECYFENTSSDFRKCADVMLVVEGQHELPCHSAILRLHSKVFDTLLTTDSLQEVGKKRTGVAGFFANFHARGIQVQCAGKSNALS